MDLQEIRKSLDEIDGEMLRLFARRMALVEEVAEYKKKNGLPILDAGREEAILDKVGRRAGPEWAPYARRLYETVLAVSREYQSARMGGEER